jgi:hypothetical protein
MTEYQAPAIVASYEASTLIDRGAVCFFYRKATSDQAVDIRLVPSPLPRL